MKELMKLKDRLNDILSSVKMQEQGSELYKAFNRGAETMKSAVHTAIMQIKSRELEEQERGKSNG